MYFYGKNYHQLNDFEWLEMLPEILPTCFDESKTEKTDSELSKLLFLQRVEEWNDKDILMGGVGGAGSLRKQGTAHSKQMNFKLIFFFLLFIISEKKQ